MTYTAPIADMQFVLEGVADIGRLASAFPDYSNEIASAILDEAGKQASEVLAPLNWSGDQHGAVLENGRVRAAPGFADAYAAYTEAGWQALSFPEEWGGAGLPRALALAVIEMAQSANMSFSLSQMLTLGTVEALMAHGTPELQAAYLPKLVSGEWTGTMNLTEPQAGSDVGALKTKATPVGDGSYLIEGQKIYITWGDHDIAENIVHLVLARLPNAPEGSRGISLFLVPKFFPKDDGGLGERNDVRPIGLEKKLGIHASPTCVMAYGEGDGAKGWLIGEENKGLACMFTMMNSARLTVGVQAVAIAERAYQQALDYAKERRQGQAVGATGPGPSAIIDHPDIRRTLTDMKAKIAAGRAICYATGVAADEAEFGPGDKRAQAKRREDILTPIAKAWSSDRAIEIAYSGILIHGGMGFIEETGAAQHLRDACIAPIYEGTNGIQAIDLAGRKLSMAGGAALTELVDDIRATADACSGESDARFADFSDRLNAGASAMVACAEGLRTRMSEAPAEGLAGATPFLKLCGDVVGGWLLIKGALYALGQETSNPTYYGAKIQLARYFSETVLTAAPALVQEVNVGAALSLGLSDDALTAA